MAQYDPIETQVATITSTSQELTFEGGIQSVVLVSDTDCYVDFDTAAISQSSMLLKANLQPVQIDFRGGNVKKITVIGSSGKFYAVGIRN